MEDKQLRIGVVGIPDGWSTQELLRAVEDRTGYRHLVDMSEVAVDLSEGRVMHKGVDLCELDGLLVKKIAPAYSPDALDRVELLKYVAGRGVRVFSPPDSMMPLIDRLSGTVRLRLGGIPMPDTIVTEDLDEAMACVEKYGKVIAKPLYTSKARGMTKFVPNPELREQLATFKAAGNPVMYLQRMIPIPGQDLGVAFLGGKYLATYARVQAEGEWKTSTAVGGKYRTANPSDEIIELARKAQALFDLDFTCVDVVETEAGPQVFEVSAFGGFRGLKNACGVDAAADYADYAIKELKTRG